MAEPAIPRPQHRRHRVHGRHPLHARLALNHVRCILLRKDCLPRGVGVGHAGSVRVYAVVEGESGRAAIWQLARADQLASQMGLEDSAGDGHGARRLLLRPMVPS